MKKTIFLALLIVAVLSFGCGAGKKHPVDVTYPVLNATNAGWHMANQFAIGLHDLCKVQGTVCPIPQIVTKWDDFDNLADQVDATLEQLDAAWIQLGELDSPENLAEFQQQVTELNKLLDEVMKLIPGLKISKAEYYRTPDGKHSIRYSEVNYGK